MAVLKKISIVFLIVIILACIALNLGAMYIRKNADLNLAPVTNNFGKLPNPNGTGDEYAFVFRYFSNKNEVGKEMLEFKLSYYTGIAHQSIYSLGIQIMEPSKIQFKQITTDVKGSIFDSTTYIKVQAVDLNATYFSTTNGVSFTTLDNFNAEDYIYHFSMDGKKYGFDFQKETEINTNTVFFVKTTQVLHANFEYFLMRSIANVKGLTGGQGIYNGLTFEHKYAFNIYEENKATGKYENMANEFIQTTDYVASKVEYYNRGVLGHEDSIFKQIGPLKGGVIWQK